MIADFFLKIMQDIMFFAAAWLCKKPNNICAYYYANENSYMIVLYGHLSCCVKSIKVMSADLSPGRHFDKFINSCYIHVWFILMRGSCGIM